MTSHLYTLFTNPFGVHWSRLVLSNGSSWVEIAPPLHLITERDPVSEILCLKKPMTLDSAHNNSHIYDHTVHLILVSFPRYILRVFVDGVSLTEISLYYHDFWCATVRRGMDWILDLLTTYTHHSELQAITALSLISTIHSSPQHPLSLFCPAVS
jgi:hypothetical protein